MNYTKLDEKKFIEYLENKRKQKTEGYDRSSRSIVKKVVELYRTEELIQVIKNSDAVIAGGSVLSPYTNNYKTEDFDMYVNVKNARKLYDGLINLGWVSFDIGDVNNTFNLAPAYDQSFFRKNHILARTRLYRKLKKYGTSFLPIDIMIIPDDIKITDVVTNFDLTFCEIWFDGTNVYANYPEDIENMNGRLKDDYKEALFKYFNQFILNRIKKYSNRGLKIQIDCPDSFELTKPSKKAISEEWAVKFLYRQFIKKCQNPEDKIIGSKIKHTILVQPDRMKCFLKYPLSVYTIDNLKLLIQSYLDDNNISSSIDKFICLLLDKENFLNWDSITGITKNEPWKNSILTTIGLTMEQINKYINPSYFQYENKRIIQNTFHLHISNIPESQIKMYELEINKPFLKALKNYNDLNTIIKTDNDSLMKKYSVFLVPFKKNKPKIKNQYDMIQFDNMYNLLVSMVNSKFSLSLLPNILQRIQMRSYVMSTYKERNSINASFVESINYIQQIRENNMNVLYSPMILRWLGQDAIDAGGVIRAFYNQLSVRDSIEYFDQHGMFKKDKNIIDYKILSSFIVKTVSYDRGRIIPNLKLNMNGLIWILLFYPHLTGKTLATEMRKKIYEFELYEMVPILLINKFKWIKKYSHTKYLVKKEVDKEKIQDLKIFQWVEQDFWNYLNMDNETNLDPTQVNYIYEFYELLNRCDQKKMASIEENHIIKTYENIVVDLRKNKEMTFQEYLEMPDEEEEKSDESFVPTRPDLEENEIENLLDYFINKIRNNPAYSMMLIGLRFPNPDIFPSSLDLDIVDFIKLLRGPEDYDMENILENHLALEGFHGSPNEIETIKKAILELNKGDLTSNQKIDDVWNKYVKNPKNFRKLFMEYITGSEVYNYDKKIRFAANGSDCTYYTVNAHTCYYQLDIPRSCIPDFKYTLMNSFRHHIVNPEKMGMAGGRPNRLNFRLD